MRPIDPFEVNSCDALPALARRVLEVVDAIPMGRVMSYGDIAAQLGCGPRQVARAMSQRGDEVPWWRVLRSDGRCAEPVRERQLARLRREGVAMASAERVNMTQARHDPEG